jgi:Ca-activated chloride channel family protein
MGEGAIMNARRAVVAGLIPFCVTIGMASFAGGQQAKPAGPTVIVTQSDESKFPLISIYFEVRRPDVLDARRDEFRVTEDGQDEPILDFEAPVSARPTTVVLVLDRSGSMLRESGSRPGERRIDGLKRAVASFLEGLPRGSRVAVIAFGSEVELVQPFTADPAEARSAVDALRADGGTRYFDAVDEAIKLLARETGRRAILAMTDGEDTLSHVAPRELILSSRQHGLPIHTLGLGTGEAVTSGALARLATETRGQPYSARDADQLRAIYEEIAKRLGSSYHLTYRTERMIPDGTLRPILIHYRGAARAGESAVFIRGMVAPAPGWPGLFLALLAGLAAIAVLPGRLATLLGKG